MFKSVKKGSKTMRFDKEKGRLFWGQKLCDLYRKGAKRNTNHCPMFVTNCCDYKMDTDVV